MVNRLMKYYLFHGRRAKPGFVIQSPILTLFHVRGLPRPDFDSSILEGATSSEPKRESIRVLRNRFRRRLHGVR